MCKRLTTEEFIKRARKVHRNKYDYSRVDYKNSHDKVKIICPIHREFEQKASNHLYGQGCNRCAILKRGQHKSQSIETFIEKSRKLHGDLYDYSSVEYVNNHTKVKIICPHHGTFEATPSDHYTNGVMCSGCQTEKRKTSFIKRAKEFHGDLYDYSLVEYVNNRTKVKIICQHHGTFEQTSQNHANRGSICPHCSNINREGSYSSNFFRTNQDEKLKNIRLYLIELSNSEENFYKIGLTKHTIDVRFEKKIPYNHKEIFSKRVNLYQGFLLEQSIITNNTCRSYRPKHKFSGHTECLTLTKSEAMDIIERIDKLQ